MARPLRCLRTGYCFESAPRREEIRFVKHLVQSRDYAIFAVRNVCRTCYYSNKQEEKVHRAPSIGKRDLLVPDRSSWRRSLYVMYWVEIGAPNTLITWRVLRLSLLHLVHQSSSGGGCLSSSSSPVPALRPVLTTIVHLRAFKEKGFGGARHG